MDISSVTTQSSTRMDRLSIGVFYFSAWSISTCLLRQYHYVSEPKTWTEAQSYCRRHYTDLATIENPSEMTQLINSVPDKSVSEVWIGLFSEVDWKWSDGYTGNGSEYRNWCSHPPEPDFGLGNEYCVTIHGYFGWMDHSCGHYFPFSCFTGSEFVFINQHLTWTEAQSYCRSNYVDLATVKNANDNQNIANMSDNWAWIGLFRDPNFNWSDGSSFSFTHWFDRSILLGSSKIKCGVAYLEGIGRWRFVPCDVKKPFVCHHAVPVVKQAVKLRMKVEDSSVDLNDPVVRADILKKLQDKLNMTGVTLKWQTQPDGKVFHKEKKRPLKKKERKTEL